MGPNALRMSERVLAILRCGDVPDELAVQSYLLMISAVNGFTMDEAGYDAKPRRAPRRPTRPHRWSRRTSAHCPTTSSRT